MRRLGLIGGNNGGGAQNFRGDVDHVRVFAVDPGGSFNPVTDLLYASAAPEPSALLLAGIGLLALGGLLRRRRA